MEALVQIFNELNARGILTTLVIFGILGMLLTIIGKIPVHPPVDIQGWRQFALGCFSLLLLIVGIFGFLFPLVVTTSSILSPQPTLIGVEPSQTPVVITATSQLIQPTAAIFSATSQPQFLTRLELSPVTEEGIVFQCDRSGQYIVTIESGVYSPWSGGAGGQWRSYFMIYRNEQVNWQQNQFGFVAPAPGSNETGAIGLMERPDQTREQAEQAAIGRFTRVSCEAGQYLRFIGADERGAYADNFGSVMVRIDITSSS
jgi:hypothetical protein